MRRILFIDDDEDDQLFFQDVLEIINPELKCSFANNGKLAWKDLNNTANTTEIIFLDLNMPVMNGFEFLSKFKAEENFKDIIIGIFTTSNYQKDIDVARQLGADFFFTKPSDFKTLKEKINEILQMDFASNKDMVIVK